MKSIIKQSEEVRKVQLKDIELDLLGETGDFEFEKDAAKLLKTVKMPVIIGVSFTMCFVMAFLIWASLAPLDSAAIAPGSVVLDSNKKTVQHLEGGIIDDILVKEGDYVTEGQPLVRLNAVTAKAKQELLTGKMLSARVAEARLMASINDLPSIILPSDVILLEYDAEVAALIKNQKSIFTSQRKILKGQIEVIKQKIEQFEKQIVGLKAQNDSVKKQLSLLREEIKSVEKLLKDGLIEKSRFLQLKQREAVLEGQQGEYNSDIARVGEGVVEAKYQILNIKNEYIRSNLEALKEVQSEVFSLREELNSSSDILDRTVITAPKSGKISDIRHHTLGGVVKPGEKIMDIVPQDDKLIIESRVSITDIDIVFIGMDAQVFLTAYKNRDTPKLNGKLVGLSADRFVDENTGNPYYKAKIEISRDSLALLAEDIELYPGMPAEVFIITGEKTFLEYLVSPISDSVRRSFREQ